MSRLCKTVGVGVDWVTATCHSYDTRDKFYSLARSIRDEQNHYGSIEDTWRFYGYDGWILRGKGHFGYGEHSSGSLIQCGGEFANKLWHRIVGLSENVSRIDIAVDAELYEPDKNLARVCYDFLCSEDVGGRKYTIMEGLMGGQTLYIGSRISDQFGRMYDKSAEAGLGELGSVWRYEVELKGKRALSASYELIHLNAKNTENLCEGMSTFVFDWFANRFIEPIFDRKGGGISALRVTAKSTYDTKIVWLRKQVSPTVRMMINNGRADQAIDALGLWDVFVEQGVARKQQSDNMSSKKMDL